MNYNSETRRKVLSMIKKGYNQETIKEITESMQLEGTLEEKEKLFKDCEEYCDIEKKAKKKAYDEAIEEAKNYLEKNPDSILIKEKLLTLYIKKAKNSDKSDALQSAMKLVIELNKIEKDNLRTISKILSIYFTLKDYNKIRNLITYVEKIEGSKTDGVIFRQILRYYEESTQLPKEESGIKLEDIGNFLNNSEIKDLVFKDKKNYNQEFKSIENALSKIIHFIKNNYEENEFEISITNKDGEKEEKSVIKIAEDIKGKAHNLASREKKKIKRRKKTAIDDELEETPKKIETEYEHDLRIMNSIEEKIIRGEEEEKLLKKTEEIKSSILKLAIQLHIQRKYGATLENLKSNIENFKKGNSTLKESEKTTLKSLSIFLNEKKRLYLYPEWNKKMRDILNREYSKPKESIESEGR